MQYTRCSHQTKERGQLETVFLFLSPTDNSRSRSPSRSRSDKSNDEVQLSAEFLSAIGKRYYEERILAPSLHSEIANRWQDVIRQGLPNDDRMEFIKKYPLPENCVFSDPPKINPELKNVVPQATLTRDARIQLKQQKIAASLAATSKALMLLIKDGKDVQDLPTIECLSDAIKLMADVQRDESIIRRSLIIANTSINSALKDTLTNTTCDNLLFGEKLDETIKSAKALENTAKDLRGAKIQNNKPKNQNAPPPRSKYSQKSAGGQRPRDPNRRSHYQGRTREQSKKHHQDNRRRR